jgi:serine/threonine protein kinase
MLLQINREVEIPGYKVERLLAEGGMASVYLATQESLNRCVALKLLKKFDRPGQSERFINEGRIIASLNHHNIITIHDIGVNGDQHYISMEYLEGGDLETQIHSGLTPQAAISLLKILGDCLTFIHRKGIVHRDIKPANILFRKDGTPVLTDFGIAKQLEQETRFTMDGTAIGSPDYLSPEQAECKPLDGRTDIYSLGILLHEMLTGLKPYQGGSYIETIMAHITEPLPTLPPHLEQYQVLLERMIAKEPANRFSSAADMITFIDTLGLISPQKPISQETVDLVRNLRASTNEDTMRTKTIEVHGGDLDVDQSAVLEARRSCGMHTQTNTVAIKTAGTNRVLTLAGVLLVVITGTAWQLYQIPETIAQVPEIVTQAPETIAQVSETVTQAPEIVTQAPETIAATTSKSKIEMNLEKARIAMNSYRLTIPEGDNALFYYTEVIRQDPDQEEAHKGLTEIANRYADLAETEINRYDYVNAKSYVHKGLSVQPENSRLLALQQRTNAVKDIPTRLFKGIKSVFE